MQDVVADAIKGFAKTMGLENLQIPSSSILKFSFENAGTLFVEDQESGTVFYLVRELAEYNLNEKLTKALQLCHYKESRNYDVQCALHESSKLVFLTWLSHQEITTSAIDALLIHLNNLHEKIADH